MKVIRSSLFTLCLLALSNCGGQTAFDLRPEGDASAGSRPLSILDDAGAGDDTPSPTRDSSVVDDDSADDEETDDSVADDDDLSEDDLAADDTDDATDESSTDDDVASDDVTDDLATDEGSEDDLVTDDSTDDVLDDLVLDDIDDLVADEGVTDDVTDDLADDSLDDESTDDASDDDDDTANDDDSTDDDSVTDDDVDPTPTSTGTGTTPTSTSTGTTPTSTSTGTTPTSTSTGTTPTTTSTGTQPPPPEELPEECDPPSTYSGRDNCYLSASCEEESLWANCFNDGGDWDCWCDSYGVGGSHSLEVTLANLGTLDACTFAANLCSTKTTIEFPDEEECAAPSESVYDESCSNNTTCTRSVEFQGGVEAVVRRQKYTNCYSGAGDDIWGCYCSDAGSSLEFEMTSAAEPRNVCKTAASICETGVSIDPQTPIECEQTGGWSDRNNRSCDADLTCAQGATVSETSITLFGSLWTNCQRGTGNTWDCTCSSAGDSAEYEFMTSTTEAFDVCSEAAAYCEEQNLVEIQVSGGGGRPIPL